MSKSYSKTYPAFLTAASSSLMFIVPVAVWLLYRADAPNALIPTVFFFTLIGGGFFFPLLKLTFMARLLNQISMGFERVDAILTEDEVVDRDTGRQPSDATITFDKVGFAYDETAVLKDVSFTARPGTVTVLVGPSGGEKQHISVARAILKDAPIVLLDEATASLDPENEGQNLERLARLIQDKTVLIIAHRLSTITQADQILVIDEGRVVERGTHPQLSRRRASTARCGTPIHRRGSGRWPRPVSWRRKEQSDHEYPGHHSRGHHGKSQTGPPEVVVDRA